MTTNAGNIGNVEPRRIDEELRASYLDYAMSVIVARALPDVRDGLKPVQRRILYAMDELAMRPGTGYKKSARLVGEVLGKYHPHGDASVYDAQVRMAQAFTMRYPMVDGQGNFGSIDNDPPAAMRYTEARLAAIATEMLQDMDKNTVNFSPNFDDSLNEPSVLPARLPFLLANGASGIAVGMATNIPPHNLRELCDAVSHMIDHPDATVNDLVPKFIKGPDFPTRGIIMAGQDCANLHAAYQTGNGRILMRGKADIEPLGRNSDRNQIVITEIPYQLNKASMVEKIAQLARDRKIEGISDVRDESDRQGLRVVVELRAGADPYYVRSNLYEQTPLQMAYNMNMLALVDGQPQVLTIRDILHHYIEFRVEVITRRAQFDLDKARDRDHILEGLLRAIDNLDEVIAIIRGSDDAEAARNNLISRFDLTQIQSQAILDMQLRRLTALDHLRLEEEHTELTRQIAELEALLNDPALVRAAVKQENQDLRKKFGDGRRTEVRPEEARRLTRDELIAHARMVVTLSNNGYAKRTSLSTYKLQHRGGKGVVGMRKTTEDDVIRHTLETDTKDTILFFTDGGRVYSFKCYMIPENTSRVTRGTPLKVLIPALPENDRVTSIVAFTDLRQGGYLVMATQKGEIKRVPLERFANIRSSGIIAMDLEEGDHLISARWAASDEDEIMVVTRNGMSVCFPVDQLRVRSRTAGGVRAIRLRDDDYVISMDVVDQQGNLLAVSENGFGKLTRMDRFRRQGRGGSGVIAFKVNEKTGPLAATLVVKGTEELVIATAKAQVQRIPLSEVGMQGRIARGVTVMRVDDDDHVTSMAILTPPDAPEEKGVTPRVARRSAAADAEAKPTTRRPRPPHGQAASDIEDAAAGAEQLGMPLEDLGLDEEDEDAPEEDIVDELEATGIDDAEEDEEEPEED
ncbi:MAG: DNA gyrase subunit A [Chloroflexi bacterium]|nr:DNA gyrase subunit A [Chloroflexota bacterium]